MAPRAFFQFLLAGAWVRAGACALVLAPCAFCEDMHFCWQGRDARRFALCVFQEASYQTRFFETKVRFLMAGRWVRAGASEVRAMVFQEASYQTRIFETKVPFFDGRAATR